MLKTTFSLLLFANVAYWLWSHEHLARWGLAPQRQGEPQRLEQQIHPQALLLFPDVADMPPEEPPTQVNAEDGYDPTGPEQPLRITENIAEVAPPQADSGAPAAPPPALVQCLQALDIEGEEGQALRRSLRAQIPPEEWEIVGETLHPGRWMVYMGRFDDAEQLERARADLRARGVEFASPGADLEPGLSLGRFSSEQNATRYLSTLSAQGVKASRVIRERPDSLSYTLRLPAASAELRAQVEALGDKVFTRSPLRACPDRDAPA